MNKISIVIPVYNGSNFLKYAIDTALAQDYPDFEVIVVNDGSRDDGATERISKSYGDKIRYYSKENGGVSSALNFGIKMMRSEYFSWLSHDDMYKPNKLSSEMKLIDKYGKDTIVYCNQAIVNQKGHQFDSTNFHKRYSLKDITSPLFLVSRCEVNGCSLLFNKSHFERVGLFDEENTTAQDMDMWLRMFRGQKLAFCEEELVMSRRHPEQGNKTIKEFGDNSLNFLRKLFDELSLEDMILCAGTPESFIEMERVVFGRYKTDVDLLCDEMCKKIKGTDQTYWKKLGTNTLADLLVDVMDRYKYLEAQKNSLTEEKKKSFRHKISRIKYHVKRKL